MSAGAHSPGEAPPSTLDLLDALEALLTDARRVPSAAASMVNDEELISWSSGSGSPFPRI